MVKKANVVRIRVAYITPRNDGLGGNSTNVNMDSLNVNTFSNPW